MTSKTTYGYYFSPLSLPEISTAAKRNFINLKFFKNLTLFNGRY